MIIDYFPGKTFSTETDGVCAITDVVVTVGAASTDTSIIAAVSGKVIQIIGGNLRSVGAVTAVTFKSASGGTNKRAYQVPVNTAATPNVELEPNPLGHFRTNVGEGLFADNSGADQLTVSLSYITYTP